MELTEPGREEYTLAEWRRRFGEPTDQDFADARLMMRHEVEAENRGLRVPARVYTQRLRLLVTGRNEERVPPRPRRNRSTPGGRRFNAAFYRVATRVLPGEYPDKDSVASESDAGDEEDIPVDDGRHHNRRDNWNNGNDPIGPGTGFTEGGRGMAA